MDHLHGNKGSNHNRHNNIPPFTALNQRTIISTDASKAGYKQYWLVRYKSAISFRAWLPGVKKTEGLSSVITLPSLGPQRGTYVILCKQQGPYNSHNIFHTHTRILTELPLKLNLTSNCESLFSGWPVWNVLWGSGADNMESREKNGWQEWKNTSKWLTSTLFVVWFTGAK